MHTAHSVYRASDSRCKRIENEGYIQQQNVDLIKPFGVRGLKMKGTYSGIAKEQLKESGVRGLKMKGTYS